MFKFETIIYWSEADQAYLAEVPELPGCMMAHGGTYEAALANAQVAHSALDRYRYGIRGPDP